MQALRSASGLGEQTVDVGDDAVGGRVHGGPVEEVPGEQVEQPVGLDLFLDAGEVAIEIVEHFPGEFFVAGGLVVLLGPAHPEGRPGGEEVLPAGGDLGFGDRAAIEAFSGEPQAAGVRRASPLAIKSTMASFLASPTQKVCS